MTAPRNFPRMAGVYSSPRIPLPRATPGNNARRRASVTFYINTNWTAPMGLRVIPRMIGKGADGRLSSGSPDYHYGYRTYESLHYKQNGGPEQAAPEADRGWLEQLPVPSNYCSTPVFDGPDLEYWYCYRYVSETHDEGDYVPPTTGEAASGFGRTFPGGAAAQPAQVVAHLNTGVISGTIYPVVVPAGGYITIEH